MYHPDHLQANPTFNPLDQHLPAKFTSTNKNLIEK